MAGQSTDHLPSAPQRRPSLTTYLSDFYNLSTTRPSGFGVGVISWLAVEQYAAAQRYDEFQCYFLHKLVSALDPIYVEHRNNELKSRQVRK